MSESKWSPEPWWWRNGSKMDAGMNEVVVDAEDIVVCPTVPQTKRGSARRIVACVNACAGIPTEALEAGKLAAGALLGLQYVTTEPLLPIYPELGASLREILRALGRLP